MQRDDFESFPTAPKTMQPLARMKELGCTAGGFCAVEKYKLLTENSTMVNHEIGCFSFLQRKKDDL